MIEKIDLAGTPWQFCLSKEDPAVSVEGQGMADAFPAVDFADEIMLPSTVSQEQKSPKTGERSDGYLTDPYCFEGYALYQKKVMLSADDAGELFLVLERTRTSRVWVNGAFAGTCNSLCTAHRYLITEYVRQGENTITILVDNVSCPVPGGHMTSRDTQTNWLGVIGEIAIERLGRVRAEGVKIYPDHKTSSVTVTGRLVGGSGEIAASVEGFAEKKVSARGDFSFVYEMPSAELWSEHHPTVYRMDLRCGQDVLSIPFGMRNFGTTGKDIVLNGGKIFLRGKHDGMVFPLTGAAPTDKESWLRVMGIAREHGINHYRFHTCCPPEAAFAAADELGIYMEPELPFWGSVEEEITPAQQYLVDEGYRILDCFANHPSFFALSLGNELWGSRERLNSILGEYRAYDPRPLYTQGSNNFQFQPCILENEDFFVGVRFSRERLFRGSYAMCDAPQGHIQTDAPDSDYTYDAQIRPDGGSADSGCSADRGGTIEIQFGTGVKTVSLGDAGGELIAEVPVVSHEIGQYFMYPDYREIPKYKGVLKPYNLEIFRERLQKAGLGHLADRYFWASGRFAADCYKREIETALRSRELSGFQLLDLQDFPGQGTALVGVLNAFMESKGVISPQEWRQFCSDRVILGCLPRFVFTAGERIAMPVMLYSYGAEAVTDPVVAVTVAFVTSDGAEETREYTLSAEGCFWGGVFELGSLELAMPEKIGGGSVSDGAVKAVIRLSCGEMENHYDIWVFPKLGTADVREQEQPAGMCHAYVTDWTEAKERLGRGENVLFLPERLAEDKAIEGTYCTDFWNYPMFNGISESMNKPRPVGTLGLLIDNTHPALSGFPSETYSTAQWYDIVTDSQCAILDGTGLEPIVRVIDNCQRNHSLGVVFEARAGGGNLLVCTARLERKLSSVSCVKLLRCMEEYVSSERFAPVRMIEISVLDKLFLSFMSDK